MSIPNFFESVKNTNQQTSREHFIVDDGLLLNFPVWLFEARSRSGPPSG
jgi:predicted acylesterase/phospholipase RssA